jgi:hypothetical protein
MLENQTSPSNVMIPPDETSEEVFSAISPQREAILRNLLDGPSGNRLGNYDSALRLGLIDLFYYDPQTGQDGLVHTLSGEIISGDDGAQIPEGFHHEPSGSFGPHNIPSTVNRAHLDELNARKRANYQEHPFEPYQAKVHVAGSRKLTRQVDTDTNQEEIKDARNFMFPKEYDSLVVLQAVRIALENRDRGRDRIADNGKIIGEGFAPMIDDKSLMQIRLILDPQSEKVIAAYPMVKFRGIMNLSEIALQRIGQLGEI